ncbi:5-carboxymethyl-2-hydroxymuconate Delta-isomerase [Aquabacter spiritensis]|nr:5-carboxymethyl-2-hydroxymuconate Delta-isomerase [Aquabacter spiritensis]
MPHITLECSENLETATDLDTLCRALHAAVLSSGMFELGAIRVRAMVARHYAVADLDPRNSFLHIQMRIGEGRPLGDIKEVGEHLFETASRHLAPLLSTSHFALSLEVNEINSALSWKKNAIHPRLRVVAGA